MNLAVFSDVHGNSVALRACVAFADHLRADGYVFLGDYITDCPDARGTLDLMRDCQARKPSFMIRGNREQYLLAHREARKEEWTRSVFFGNLLYTYERLTDGDFAMLAAMPDTLLVDLAGCPVVRLYHAAPNDPRADVFPGTEAADAILRAVDAPVTLVGHSHFQFRYEAFGRQLINPGSVGMPVHGHTKAQFAMLSCEGSRWSARMMNVEYDRAEAVRLLDASGLDEYSKVYAAILRDAYRTGNCKLMECMRLAGQLARQDGLQDTDDMHWELAAKQLSIL